MQNLKTLRVHRGTNAKNGTATDDIKEQTEVLGADVGKHFCIKQRVVACFKQQHGLIKHEGREREEKQQK